MKLTYRIGQNSKDALGVFEAEFDKFDMELNNENLDGAISSIKALYLKHRLLADNDPAKIQKELRRIQK